MLAERDQKQIFYQAYHHKGLGMVDKGAFIKSPYKLPLLVTMGEIAFGITSPLKESGSSHAYFKQHGYRYLVVHEAYVHEEARAPLREFLDAELGDPERYEDDQILRYRLLSADDLREIRRGSPAAGRPRRTHGPPP